MDASLPFQETPHTDWPTAQRRVGKKHVSVRGPTEGEHRVTRHATMMTRRCPEGTYRATLFTSDFVHNLWSDDHLLDKRLHTTWLPQIAPYRYRVHKAVFHPQSSTERLLFKCGHPMGKALRTRSTSSAPQPILNRISATTRKSILFPSALHNTQLGRGRAKESSTLGTAPNATCGSRRKPAAHLGGLFKSSSHSCHTAVP